MDSTCNNQINLCLHKHLLSGLSLTLETGTSGCKIAMDPAQCGRHNTFSQLGHNGHQKQREKPKKTQEEKGEGKEAGERGKREGWLK